MLRKIGGEIVGLIIGGVSLSELRKGYETVWQAVRSCFGSGGWVNDKPWLNDEGWKNS